MNRIIKFKINRIIRLFQVIKTSLAQNSNNKNNNNNNNNTFKLKLREN